LFIYAHHVGSDVDLRVWGELDSFTAGDLDRELDRIVTGIDPGGLVVVDTRALTFIDSTGIRTLMRARADVRRRGGRFRLQASEALRRLLGLLGAEELLLET
jgi:anti-anti-sigma factor